VETFFPAIWNILHDGVIVEQPARPRIALSVLSLELSQEVLQRVAKNCNVLWAREGGPAFIDLLSGGHRNRSKGLAFASEEHQLSATIDAFDTTCDVAAFLQFFDRFAHCLLAGMS
jgi:hypothetical protein